MFVDLSAKLQTRVVDAFAAHDSVLEAAHEKCKDKHPELHAKYQKAKKLIEFADRHLAMLQTAERTKKMHMGTTMLQTATMTKKMRMGTTSKQSLLSRRSHLSKRMRKGGFLGPVFKAVDKHVISPAAKAVDKHVISPVAKAAVSAYKTAGSAVKGIADGLDDIAEVRKRGQRGPSWCG